MYMFRGILRRSFTISFCHSLMRAVPPVPHTSIQASIVAAIKANSTPSVRYLSLFIEICMTNIFLHLTVRATSVPKPGYSSLLSNTSYL